MVNVVIGKIPQGVKLPKFMNFLKKAIFRCKKEMHVNYFWHGTNGFSQLSVSTTFKKALKVKKSLDGFFYIHAKGKYPLECWLENLDEDEIPCVPLGDNHIQPEWNNYREDSAEYEPPQKIRRSRSPVQSKSRSPDHSNKLNDIELKIELVKKQRILFEEESKLLLEKRKLEYLKKMGPNDYGNLGKFEEICGRNDPTEISEFLRSVQPSKPFPKNSAKPNLPGFVGPCNQIIIQMKALISSQSEITLENRSLFYNLLRTTLKQRLTVIMKGRELLPTNEVVKLYRIQHPKETDAHLVSELCNTIKTSCGPQKRQKKKGFVPLNVGGQSTEAQKPPADTKEIDLTAADEGEGDHSIDASQLIDFDDYVDMENDVENWTEDDANEVGDAKGNEGQSVVNEEPTTSRDDVTEPKMAEEIIELEEKSANDTEEVAASTDSNKLDVDEVVLIADDADISDQKADTEDVKGQTTEEKPAQ